MISVMEAKRSSAGRDRARITTAAASSGTRGSSSRMGTGSSMRMRAITWMPEPFHGSSPVSSS